MSEHKLSDLIESEFVERMLNAHSTIRDSQLGVWRNMAAALEAKLETGRLEISVLRRRAEDAEAKVEHQAEQITRLETSRASLRVALAAAQQEEQGE